VSTVGIVLVDDHPAVRAGLEGLLDEDDGVRILATAATGRDGYEAIRRLRPDAAVVDHHLPDESGLSLCLRVQALKSAPRVVIYSAFADARLCVLGVIAGAVGVIPKSAAPDDVLAAVRGDDPTPRHGGQLTARALREVGTGLDAGDLAILGMLAHGVRPADIADTLSIDEAWLTARRWAMLERVATPSRRLPLRRATHGLREVALPA